VVMNYVMEEWILILLRINFIPARLLSRPDVIVGLVADVCIHASGGTNGVVVCQCRRCACMNPRSSNLPQDVSREDSEHIRGGCCGSREGTNKTKPMETIEKRKSDPMGFGGDQVEVAHLPEDDAVAVDQIKPACCK
jgi:hypothetical protein